MLPKLQTRDSTALNLCEVLNSPYVLTAYRRRGTNFLGFNSNDAFCLSHVGFKRNSEADCLGDQEKGLCIAFTGEQCVLGEVFGSHETLQPKMAISIVRLPRSTFRKETTTTKC